MPESELIVTFRPHVFYPKSIEKTCVQKGKDVKTLCSCADLCGGCVHIHRAVGTYGDIGDFTPFDFWTLFVIVGARQIMSNALTDLKTYRRA